MALARVPHTGCVPTDSNVPDEPDDPWDRFLDAEAMVRSLEEYGDGLEFPNLLTVTDWVCVLNVGQALRQAIQTVEAGSSFRSTSSSPKMATPEGHTWRHPAHGVSGLWVPVNDSLPMVTAWFDLSSFPSFGGGIPSRRSGLKVVEVVGPDGEMTLDMGRDFTSGTAKGIPRTNALVKQLRRALDSQFHSMVGERAQRLSVGSVRSITQSVQSRSGPDNLDERPSRNVYAAATDELRAIVEVFEASKQDEMENLSYDYEFFSDVARMAGDHQYADELAEKGSAYGELAECVTSLGRGDALAAIDHLEDAKVAATLHIEPGNLLWIWVHQLEADANVALGRFENAEAAQVRAFEARLERPDFQPETLFVVASLATKYHFAAGRFEQAADLLDRLAGTIDRPLTAMLSVRRYWASAIARGTDSSSSALDLAEASLLQQASWQTDAREAQRFSRTLVAATDSLLRAKLGGPVARLLTAAGREVSPSAADVDRSTGPATAVTTLVDCCRSLREGGFAREALGAVNVLVKRLEDLEVSQWWPSAYEERIECATASGHRRARTWIAEYAGMEFPAHAHPAGETYRSSVVIRAMGALEGGSGHALGSR